MIYGTYGRGGSGKSHVTVNRLWKMFSGPEQKDIASNTPLIDLAVVRRYCPNADRRLYPTGFMWCPLNVKTFGRSWASRYLISFVDIYDLDNCECLLDELGAWMPSHKGTTMPEEVRRFLAQDRREGVNIHWTHRTTDVFRDVLSNTAEMTVCMRWGPLIVARSYDPQEKDRQGHKSYHLVRPSVFQRYDTYAKIGDPVNGEGYGQGRRKAYKMSATTSPFRYKGILETTSGGVMPFDIGLSAGQASVLVRMFGPEVLGIHRVGERGGVLNSGRKLTNGSTALLGSVERQAAPLVKYAVGPLKLPELIPYPS